MLTAKQAQELAQHWIEAWNAHDIDAIISHYDDDVVLISPVALKLLNIPSGTVKGKPALKAYFAKGLEFFPDLRFELVCLMWGVSTVNLHYKNHKGVDVGEVMEVGPNGKITRVVVQYNE